MAGTWEAQMVEPLHPVQTASAPEKGAAWFVWGIWALAVYGGLAFARYGNKFPYADDWALVPVLTGEQPLTARWLWTQHSDHRIAVPKLILLTALRLTGWDFRGGILFNVGALGALAFAMIRGAKRLRGWTSYADAYFPLALLHWGHGSLWWDFQVQFVCSTVLAGIVLL